jgi:FMN-dependent oxidoreductase (nitrilotriacetate monooxygenase family)
MTTIPISFAGKMRRREFPVEAHVADQENTMSPTRKIRLNAFDMACVGHIQHGMWTHPRDRSSDYTSLEHWVSLARLLERGLFDGLFLADILGVYDVLEGTPGPSLRASVQIPLLDPTALIPAMAYATTNLGFGVTCNLAYEPPFLFARRMATLDHLTGGRIGWNIVTGYLDSAARAMGLREQMAHDDRYDLAEEYMRVVYALWEGGWRDDAVVRDRGRRVYTEPGRVRAVRHEGKQYRLDTIPLWEPSPQRTPVLYQAGASDRGRVFAARHAECVFVNGADLGHAARVVSDLRTRAGSRPIQVFAGVTVVTAPTEAEARDRLEEYRRHTNVEGALAHAAASLGIDFDRFDMDQPIDASASQAIQSNIESIASALGLGWTKRMLIDRFILGSRQTPIVGSPSQVADALQHWVAEADVDGFNLSRTVIPECLEDFIALIVPALQDRGAFKTSYDPGTYRRKLFGALDRLPDEHPAARERWDAA